ncbi:unnamed protein product [Heterobilharzia americana]|nr:unnamed protein product [Heterobilharzia americana]
MIHNSNGIIKTTTEIDYESVNTYILFIIIYDVKKIQQALTTSVIINIVIEDLNDNPPEFILPPLNELQFDGYSIIEPIKSLNGLRVIEFEEETIQTKSIGNVKALDRDNGKNAEIVYFIAELTFEKNEDTVNTKIFSQLSSNENYSNQPKILIDSDGSLWCEGRLDREKTPIIDLVIGAHDLGEPKLTSYTKMRIILTDINDNSPEWQFPTKTDFLVSISKLVSVGTIITRVRAIDNDEPLKNGYVKYYISSFNNEKFSNSNSEYLLNQIISYFFILDCHSGELKVKHSLTILPDGFLEIWLKAEDNGSVHRNSLAKLVIYLTNDQNLLEINSPEKLSAYYQKEKHTKQLTSQIHSLGKLTEIIPSVVNTDSTSLYIYSSSQSMQTLSLLIGGGVIATIIIICLILLSVRLKLNRRFRNRSKYATVGTHECDNVNKLSVNNQPKETFVDSQLSTSRPNNECCYIDNDKCNYESDKEINKMNTMKPISSSNETYISCSSTSVENTIHALIPVSMLRSSEELHYSPISSVFDFTDKIPLQLLHVSNETFAVPLCITQENSITTDRKNTDQFHSNMHQSINEQMTSHSLAIVATVVPTCNMKSNVLPVLPEDQVGKVITTSYMTVDDEDDIIKLDNFTHSDAYYTTFTPCILTTTANTS